ncbi:MAG: 3-phosphoshikimate 1-carboxyvinyltransferase, partial [Muribaculaceae bacterium]|nr:3-phosphoshikimate 1-carboxyvinyltransferase [Muribaculaceae bacterium]
LTVPSEETAGATELTPSPEIYGRLDLDLTENPDLAPALAVTCCLIGVPFRFVGLGNLGVKESDRLEAICLEMDKLGRRVEKVRDSGLEWDGKGHPVKVLPELDAHGDHRIAMALAPVGIYVPGIVVGGVESVSKSYPEYWEQLRQVGFRLEERE